MKHAHYVKISGPVQSEFYTFSLVQSVWSGPKNIHNPHTHQFPGQKQTN